MIDLESIVLFFSTAAGVWVAGFSYGKAIAWLRQLRNAA